MAGTTKNTNIITINGKRYDSFTGELLGMPPRTPDTPAPGRVIDGIVRRPASAVHAQPSLKVRPVPAPAKPTAILVPKKMPRAHTMDIPHAPAKHTKAHQPQHAQTLMRRAVTKPKPSLKRHVRAQVRTDILVKQPSFTIAPKLSYTSTDPRRVAHAKRIARSELIRKFAPSGTAPHTPAPRAAQTVSATKRATIPTTLNDIYTYTPAATRPTAHTPMDIFEQALAIATSHEQPPVKLKKQPKASKKGLRLGRFANVGTTIFAIVLLCGFFAYENKANFMVHVASARAGFHVALPGYEPSGFSVAGVHYNPGVATINFHSNSDDRAFILTQKVSQWDSQALLNDFVATNDQPYQAYEAAGRTVYVYNGNATWVNSGVWYQLKGDNSLTTDQLVRMAASI